MASVRADLERVKMLDAKHPAGGLHPRMRAVLEAQAAMIAREPGARYAYRAALIDLAAVAEATAADLPAPTLRANGTRAGWNIGHNRPGHRVA